MLIHKSQPHFAKFISNFTIKSFSPIYGHHSKNSAKNDRYGAITLPSKITFEIENIFEIEVEKNEIIKFGIRLPYTADLDLIFIAKPNYFVKTVWLNEKVDSHKSLRAENYI